MDFCLTKIKIRFLGFQERKHAPIRPLRCADRRPVVKVIAVAPKEQSAVDSARAPDDSPSGYGKREVLR